MIDQRNVAIVIKRFLNKTLSPRSVITILMFMQTSVINTAFKMKKKKKVYLERYNACINGYRVDMI